MPVDDPSLELEAVIQKSEAGILPSAAKDWALNALHTTDGILRTVSAMIDAGKSAPTPNQRTALANIHIAAMKWLGGNPVEPAPPPLPPPPGAVIGTFKMLDPKTGKLVTKTVKAK